MLTRRSSAAAKGAGGTPTASKGHHHHDPKQQSKQQQQQQHSSIPESEGKGGERTHGDAKHKGPGGGFVGTKPLLLGVVM